MGAGTANGSPVILWPCLTGAWSQQWLPTATGAFYNPVSGHCLDVAQGRIDNGTPLQLWDCHQGNAQRWSATGLASPLAGPA